jgi:phosphoheptose isomerase
VRASFEESARVTRETLDVSAAAIAEAAELLTETFHRGGKVLAFGNGGSAADAQHLAAELAGRFDRERPALPAMALTANSSDLTAIGNDYGFEQIFARLVDAHGRAGDLAIAISTSGNSTNVNAAVRAARARGLRSIGLVGKGGGNGSRALSPVGPRVSRRPIRIDRSKLRTVSARSRRSKMRLRDEAKPHRCGASLAEFLEGLPAILGAADLLQAIDAAARAFAKERTLLWGLGAHVIKVGLAPIVVDLLERGLVSGVMMNGAGCVHDLELAMMGQTSEDVASALDDGSFGMARETAERLNRAIAGGARDGLGMGAAIGREILKGDYPHGDRSILAGAARLEVPVTVHSAIGTDVHHMHPGADGAALGATSYRDFEILTGLVSTLEGGVYFNVGSAVILPEVFLKALSLARNLGRRLRRFTTVDLDFIRHYRATVNVVERPTRLGGKGLALVGHHEILVPLLAAGLIEHTEGRGR